MEEIKKPASADPSKKVFDYMVRAVKAALKANYVKVNKLDENDLQMIAIEWLKTTVTSGYVEETLSSDIGENDKITKILKKKGAWNDDDNYDDDYTAQMYK